VLSDDAIGFDTAMAVTGSEGSPRAARATEGASERACVLINDEVQADGLKKADSITAMRRKRTHGEPARHSGRRPSVDVRDEGVGSRNTCATPLHGIVPRRLPASAGSTNSFSVRRPQRRKGRCSSSPVKNGARATPERVELPVGPACAPQTFEGRAATRSGPDQPPWVDPRAANANEL